jgi:hypothetical protein
VLQNLNALFQEYYHVPVKRKKQGENNIVWKDPEALTAMYKSRAKDISAMDEYLYKVSELNNRTWSDDASFSRVTLEILWTALNPQEETLKSATDVLNEFLKSTSKLRLEEQTKKILDEAYFRNQKGYWSANLSYEQNAEIALRIYLSQLLIRQNAYDEAINQLNIALKNFPNSGYSQFLTSQREAVVELKEGRLALPDPSTLN